MHLVYLVSFRISFRRCGKKPLVVCSLTPVLFAPYFLCLFGSRAFWPVAVPRWSGEGGVYHFVRFAYGFLEHYPPVEKFFHLQQCLAHCLDITCFHWLLLSLRLLPLQLFQPHGQLLHSTCRIAYCPCMPWLPVPRQCHRNIRLPTSYSNLCR